LALVLYSSIIIIIIIIIILAQAFGPGSELMSFDYLSDLGIVL
jgi:hypothetical protein